MVKDKIIIRSYEQGDEERIMELMSPYWKHLISKKNWNWEFKKCPSGFALIKVAEHNGKIVGHYSLLPMEMKCGNKKLLGGKMEGSVVHEDYRGNVADRFFPEENDARIFNKLIESMFESAEKTYRALLWGFPNEASIKSQVRVGYSHMSIPLRIMILPIDVNRTFQFLFSTRFKNKVIQKLITWCGNFFYVLLIKIRCKRRFKKENGDSEASVKNIQRFDEEINHFWERYSKQNNCITIKRDEKYLNWRFADNPVISHKIFIAEKRDETIGYIVTNISHNSSTIQGNIVDILMLKNNEAGLNLLLNTAINNLMEQKVDFIRVWTVKGNKNYERYQNAFRRYGFLMLPNGKLNMILKANYSVCPKEFVHNMNNWYITMAFLEGTS